MIKQNRIQRWRLKALIVAVLFLNGCTSPMKMYPGPERPGNEVSSIHGDSKNRNPDIAIGGLSAIVITAVNKKTTRSALKYYRAHPYEVIVVPGRYEIEATITAAFRYKTMSFEIDAIAGQHYVVAFAMTGHLTFDTWIETVPEVGPPQIVSNVLTGPFNIGAVMSTQVGGSTMTTSSASRTADLNIKTPYKP